MTMTCVTAWHHAVKKVDSAVYRLKNVLRCANPHQITGLILRHIRLNSFDDAIHFFGFFTDSETSDCVTGGIKLTDLFHVTDAEIGVCASLVDTEEKLTGVDGLFKL